MSDDFAPRELISNGSSAMITTERVDKDPHWKAPGWRGIAVGLEAFGGAVGMSTFVPDYLLRSWRRVPLEWSPVIGGGLEERYVSAGQGRYRREVRATEDARDAD